MTKGDNIKTVDGQVVKTENIATLLYGSGATDRLDHYARFTHHALPGAPAYLQLGRARTLCCMCAPGGR
jgi:hypothetical protein